MQIRTLLILAACLTASILPAETPAPPPASQPRAGAALRVPAGFRAKEGTAAEPYSNTGWAREIVHEATGIELVFAPAGKFMMGSPANERARMPGEDQHEVTLTRPFYIGRCEVAQAQWKQVMGENPAQFKNEQAPVECVSWEACREFLRKAGGVLTLPTEAQWEYACRARTTARFCCGDDEKVLPEYAWFGGGGTHPVAQKKPNAWGIHDMHGNVYEWCADWFAPYPPGAATDPTGPATGEEKVMRGGCYRYSPQKCRSAKRLGAPPAGGFNNLGFRVVLNLDA